MSANFGQVMRKFWKLVLLSTLAATSLARAGSPCVVADDDHASARAEDSGVLIVAVGDRGTVAIVNSDDPCGARWLHITPNGKAKFLGAGLSAMHEVGRILASPDDMAIAVESYGEGHPIVEIVNLEALLRGRYEVTASVDPYPGSVGIGYWRGDGLVIRSDVPLHLAGADGRVPLDAADDFEETSFVLNPSNGSVRVITSPIPRP